MKLDKGESEGGRERRELVHEICHLAENKTLEDKETADWPARARTRWTLVRCEELSRSLTRSDESRFRRIREMLFCTSWSPLHVVSVKVKQVNK